MTTHDSSGRRTTKLLNLWDLATVGKPGSDGVSNNPSGKAKEPDAEPNPYNIRVRSEPLHGTSAQYAIRKLRKDSPELHARVLAGELSPNRAMIEAG